MNIVTKIQALYRSPRFWVLADQGLFSAGSFFTTILIARSFSIELFGLFSEIILVSFLLLSISSSFITAPFQVLYSFQQNRAEYKSAVFYLQMFLAVVLFVLPVGYYAIFSNVFTQYNIASWQIGLYFSGFILLDFFRKFFLTANAPHKAFVVDFVSISAQTAVLLFFVFFKSLTFKAAFLTMGLTYIPAIIVAVLFLKPVTVSSLHLTKYFKLHIANGKWFFGTSVLQWFGQNFLIAAAGAYLGAAVFAAFRLAQTLFGVFNAILQMFENYAVPLAADIYNTSVVLHFTQFLKKLTINSMLIMLPVVMAVIVFAEDIFTLAGGPAYANYSIILQLMALLYLLVFLSNPVRIAVRVLLLNREFFIAHIISFMCSLVFAFFLIQHLNVYGVVIGLMCNQLCMLLYWQIVLNRKNIVIWK